MYILSENKGADQLCSYTAQLICGFVFAHADCWFSDKTAQILAEQTHFANSS